MSYNPIICALDTTDVTKAVDLARRLKGAVGTVKLGLEFFSANGMPGVREIEKTGMSIFLDLKFHDIPNTVTGALKALKGIENMFMLTVHASGGRKMMEEAVRAVEIPSSRSPKVIGVTVLTSIDKNDLGAIGVNRTVEEQAVQLAVLAKSAGLSGVVCSGHEIAAIRKACGPNFTLVVPGIRPAGSEHGDQKRTMTPKEAMEKGADYLVIGRPITGAANPKQAAEAILRSL